MKAPSLVWGEGRKEVSSEVGYDYRTGVLRGPSALGAVSAEARLVPLPQQRRMIAPVVPRNWTAMPVAEAVWQLFDMRRTGGLNSAAWTLPPKSPSDVQMERI